MTIKRAAFAACSVAILSVGTASAATCNQGRVTGTELCRTSVSESVRKDAAVRSEKSLGAQKIALISQGKTVTKRRQGLVARSGMFSETLKSAVDNRQRPSVVVNEATKQSGGTPEAGEGTAPRETLVVNDDGGSDLSVVPLPAAGFLLLAGLGGFMAIRRKR